MRRYPANSPQAAARIVALTAVADGDIGDAEIEWLDRLGVYAQLGLARQELHALLDTFCEDLLSSEQLKWADACPVDERTLANQHARRRAPWKPHHHRVVQERAVRYRDAVAMTAGGPQP